MIIYRFEKDGIGPFVGGASSFWDKSRLKYRKKQDRVLHSRRPKPVPFTIVKRRLKKDRIYGCPSKDMLRAYFGDNFKPLFKQGYRIKRYQVPDDEVLDMGYEVSFPVRYHQRLQSTEAIKRRLASRSRT